MPYPRPELNGATSSDLIVYPVDHMRETAAKVLVNASNAQSHHDAVWQQIQSHVYRNFDPTMQETVIACLKPYADRLRASYDWQLNFASALFDAVDAISTTEGNVTQSLTPGPR